MSIDDFLMSYFTIELNMTKNPAYAGFFVA